MSSLGKQTYVSRSKGLPELGGVELRSQHVEGVPGDHRHAAEDAAQDQTLDFGPDHVDEEHAQAGHQQAAGWRRDVQGTFED